MKKIVFLFAFLAMLFSSSFAQIGGGGCSNYRSYIDMKDDTDIDDYKYKEFYSPIIGYGDTREKAIYNAKILALRTVMYNQMYLENPIVDSLMAEFAGEILLVKEDDLIIKKKKGQYRCKVFEVKYNEDLLEYIKMYVDNFLKMQAIFIVNPHIIKFGDVGTKDVYNNARGAFETNMAASKYHLDGIVEGRMLETADLLPKPANYDPCTSFKYYETGNPYLDLITGIKLNSNQQINIDIVFSIDTITITHISSNEKLVTFRLMAIDAHNANVIMIYEAKSTEDAINDKEAVEMAINKVFSRDADAIMYELMKRYSNYIRTAQEFSLLICDDLLDNNKIAVLEGDLASCKLFAQGSIRPGEWTNNGVSIGNSYNGRTYILDQLVLRSNITKLLIGAGFQNFDVYVTGTTYIVLPVTN